MRVCAFARVPVLMRAYTWGQCACVRALSLRACVHMRTSACVRARVRARVYAHVCVSERGHVQVNAYYKCCSMHAHVS